MTILGNHKTLPVHSVWAVLQQLRASQWHQWWRTRLPVEEPGDLRGVGLVPGWRSSVAEGVAARSSLLARRSPWPEQPDRPESTGSQRPGTTNAAQRTSAQSKVAEWAGFSLNSNWPNAAPQRLFFSFPFTSCGCNGAWNPGWISRFPWAYWKRGSLQGSTVYISFFQALSRGQFEQPSADNEAGV